MVKKRTNTRQKGFKSEREYEAKLNEQGYITQRVKGSSIYNKNVDFFGCWDIIGFNCTTKRWILVQVKTNRTGGFIKKGKAWFAENKPPHCDCYLAIRYDNKPKDTRWRIILLD